MARFSRIYRAGIAALAGCALLGLAACTGYNGSLPKHMRPLDGSMRSLIKRKGMDERAPILIRIFKEEARMEVWKKQRATGRFALLKDYNICAWSGVLGPKKQEGDRQAPEGYYTIRPAQMNPDSNYYLAFNMGYPNAFDRSLGRTGSELMVHGACSSAGCYSMTDQNIQEIYTLGRLAFQGGQREFQVEAYPFRMTPENLARHRNDPNIPFWLMIKEGYDHFQITGEPPKVNVCDHRYVFDAVSKTGSFDPSGKCPPMSMPETLRSAVAQKEARDNAKMLLIAERMDQREKSDGAKALQVALATPTTAERAGPMSVATGTLPAIDSQQPAASPAASVASASAPAKPATAVATAPLPMPRPSRTTVASAAPAAAAPVPATPTMQTLAVPAPSAATASNPGAAARAPQATPAPADASQLASSEDPHKKILSKEETKAVEERMLVESAPVDPNVASAYAEAQPESGGLTGFVMRLMKKQ